MSAEACVREMELLDALARGYVGPELMSHVMGCDSCSELHAVAGAVLDERVSAMAEAAVPAAGTMWFRLQMRHRQEARASARRALIFGQAATLLIAIVLVASLFGTDLAFSVKHALTTLRASGPLLIAAGAWLLLAPIAGYVAIRQK